MVRITEKDRIFLAIALPAALVALYFFVVRAPLARQLSAMRSRYEALGPAAEIEAGRPALERRREEAAARLAAAEAAEAKRLAAASGGEESAVPVGDGSARFSSVVALLDGVEGVKIASAERVGETGNAEPRAKYLVRETLGAAEPDLWRFTVNADYGAIMRALAEARERKLPAIVDGVSFAGVVGSGASRIWRIDVWL